MALPCIISEIKRDIGRKSRFFITHLHSTTRRIVAIKFGKENLEWWIYQKVKRFENMSTRFDTIHERDRRTDRHRTTA